LRAEFEGAAVEFPTGAIEERLLLQIDCRAYR